MTPEERYQLTTLLAHRHKSELWLAVDQTTGKEVLFKLFGEWTDDFLAFRRALHAEATMVQRMSHPQLTKVYDVGTWQGRDFLTMEYVKGETLYSFFQRLRQEEKFLPLTLAVRWITQIGSLLDYVDRFPHHETQVPLRWKHRRLMMDQLLVTPDLNIKVLGFGTPRHFIHLDSQSIHNYRRPWRYLPQEVLRGVVTSDASNNDLWVLGLLLYELCTSCKAFRYDWKENISALSEVHSVVHGNLRRPMELREDFPLTLQRLIGFAMHPSPEERFGSIPDFLDGLSLFLALERLRSLNVSPSVWMQQARECLHDNNLVTLLGMLRLGAPEDASVMFQDYLWQHLRHELQEPLKAGHPLAWPHRALIRYLPVAAEACYEMLQSPDIPESTQMELLESLEDWPQQDAFLAMCGALQGHSAQVARNAHQRMEKHSHPPPLAWKKESQQIQPCPHRWEEMLPVDNEPFNRIRYCEQCNARTTRIQDVEALQKLGGEHCVAFSPEADPNEHRALVQCLQQFWWLSPGERLRLGGDPEGDFFNPEMEGEVLLLVNQGHRRLALQYENADPDWLPSLNDSWVIDLELMKIRNDLTSGTIVIGDVDQATLNHLEERSYLSQPVPAIPLPETLGNLPEQKVSFCETDQLPYSDIPLFFILREKREMSRFILEENLLPALFEEWDKAQGELFCSYEEWQQSVQRSLHGEPDNEEREELFSESFSDSEDVDSSGLWNRIRSFFRRDS